MTDRTRISLREVAARAGVSDATVSRVLNRVDSRISAGTQQRVHKAAADLGYQPNLAARALVTGRTQTLALWLANLREPYYASVIHHTQQEVKRHGFDLLFSEIATMPDQSLDSSKVLAWPADGILGVDIGGRVVPGLVGTLLHQKPFVGMGGYCVPTADFVSVDFTAQVAEAVRHLARIGCRRIAYMVPDWFHRPDDPRQNGYDAVMRETGQAGEYITIPLSDDTRAVARRHLREYVAERGRPDGLFCFNDDIAIGAYRGLRDVGARIPEDTAIIGCDGLEDTLYFDPPLSTLTQPIDEMCAQAWAFLQQRIAEPGRPLQQKWLHPRLEVRGSAER